MAARSFCLCLVSICALSLLIRPGSCWRLWPTQDLVVLGDSLTDNGNLFAFTNGTRPNSSEGYFEGRFSNGIVWNEYLADRFWLTLVNKAFGGAEACNRTFDIPTLRDQVAMLQGDVEAYRNTIVSFTIGGNDYLSPIRFLNQSAPAPEIVVGCIVEAVQGLLSQGFQNILIWNLPASETSVPNSPGAQALAGILPLFVRHNQVLADAVTHLQYENPQAKIMIFDFSQAFKDLFATGTRLFREPNTPCLLFDQATGALLSRCSDPDEHIMWDDLHPTTRTHSILADNVQSVLLQNYCL